MNQWPTQQQGQQPQWPPQQDVQQPQWPSLPPTPQPQWSQSSQEEPLTETQLPQAPQPQWSQPLPEQAPPWQQPSAQQPRRQFQRPLLLLPPAEPSEWSQPSQPQFKIPTPLTEQQPVPQAQTSLPQTLLQQPQVPQNKQQPSGKKRCAPRIRWILVAAIISIVLAVGVFFRYQSPTSVALSYARAGIHQDFTIKSSLVCARYKSNRPPNNVTTGDKINDSGLTTSITSETLTQSTVRVSGPILYATLGGKGTLLYNTNVQLEANGLGWCVKPV